MFFLSPKILIINLNTILNYSKLLLKMKLALFYYNLALYDFINCLKLYRRDGTEFCSLYIS